MKFAEESDETGVAAFTALPRAEWAEIRERLEQNETNKRSLRLIDSSLTMLVLDSSKVDKKVSLLSWHQLTLLRSKRIALATRFFTFCVVIVKCVLFSILS